MSHEIFAAWIKEQGLLKGKIASLLNVSAPTLTRWLSGKTLPQPVHRAAIEELTGGIVKKGDWK